jgi:hypothetical protein
VGAGASQEGQKSPRGEWPSMELLTLIQHHAPCARLVPGVHSRPFCVMGAEPAEEGHDAAASRTATYALGDAGAFPVPNQNHTPHTACA